MVLSHMPIKNWVCIAVVAVIIVVAILIMRKKSSPVIEHENLTNVPQNTAPAHAIDGKQEDIPIKPAIFDAGSGAIMSGSEFAPSQFMSPWYQAYTGDMKNHYLLDDGAGGNLGLQFNKCSKSCCSEQYPLPFKMPVDSDVCDSKSEFVPNNYTCNNAWQDTGCVCMTKDQANFIGSRGGNA